MAAQEIPSAISAAEAIRLIARNSPHADNVGSRLTRGEMVTLARVACRTEGIAWAGYTKEAAG